MGNGYHQLHEENIMGHVNNTNKGVSVIILDKEFVVACPENLEESLSAAAQFLDAQMRQIREMGRVIGTERIAVMAALNISHQLLSVINSPKTELTQDLKERLRFLSQKIDDVLLTGTPPKNKNPQKNYEDAL